MQEISHIILLILLHTNYYCAGIENCDPDAFENVIAPEIESMDNIAELKVFDLEVGALCEGSIDGYPKLLELVLVNNGIEDIQPGCFMNVPSLHELHIVKNNFGVVKKGVLNGLNVSHINLTANAIETVESGAFDDLVNLRKVELQKNQIREYSPDWFGSGVYLEELNLSDNLIEYIQEESFNNIAKTDDQWYVLKINLSQNRIHALHPAAFRGLSLRILEIDLSNNQIGKLDEKLFQDIYIMSIDLSGNALTCFGDDFLDNFSVNGWIEVKNNPWESDCWSKLLNWLQVRDVRIGIKEKPPRIDKTFNAKNSSWVYVRYHKFEYIR